MPREKENYRTNLEILMKLFPGRIAVKASEIAKVMGIDTRTVKRKNQIGSSGMISLATLASKLS